MEPAPSNWTAAFKPFTRATALMAKKRSVNREHPLRLSNT